MVEKKARDGEEVWSDWTDAETGNSRVNGKDGDWRRVRGESELKPGESGRNGRESWGGIECMKPPGIKGEFGDPAMDGHSSGESDNGLRWWTDWGPSEGAEVGLRFWTCQALSRVTRARNSESAEMLSQRKSVKRPSSSLSWGLSLNNLLGGNLDIEPSWWAPVVESKMGVVPTYRQMPKSSS